MKIKFCVFVLLAASAFGAVGNGVITFAKDGVIEARAEKITNGMSAIVVYRYGDLMGEVEEFEGATDENESSEIIAKPTAYSELQNIAPKDQIITNRCEVIATREDDFNLLGKVFVIATLKCEPFTAIDQNSVPTLRIAPREGDRVVFAPLYQNAVIIAPSVESLLAAQDRYKEFRFIHPDLLALVLMKEDRETPIKEDFAAFCDRYLVGTLVFVLEDGDYLADCHTFKEFNFFAADNAMQNARRNAISSPFYHRLKPFDEVLKTKADFANYYKSIFK
ncbi:MAG: plasminogen-binding N-terminal domain-containing protein [Helicobacteraceae bacterium]|jgi:hypothetical protein|nr:plasminogen-binding N-terminal domain-containing protein [Helicobacteraceae bacterium]